MNLEINLGTVDYYTLRECKVHPDKSIPNFYTLELSYIIHFKNGEVKELYIPCLDMSFLTYLPSIYNSKANFLMGLHEMDVIGTEGVILKDYIYKEEK